VDNRKKNMGHKEIANILQRIAMQHRAGSKKRIALEIAAKALWYVQEEVEERKWRDFVTHFHDKLTPNQLRNLKVRGLSTSARGKAKRT